jgi:opacity protein-like surface antigen
MRKVMMHKLAIIVAAIALGSAAVSADALARGGGGGHGAGEIGGGHMGGGFGGAGEFDGVPGLTPPGAFETNTPEGRSAAGLNFNSQLRNGAMGAQPPASSRRPPQPGTMNGSTGTNSMP